MKRKNLNIKFLKVPISEKRRKSSMWGNLMQTMSIMSSLSLLLCEDLGYILQRQLMTVSTIERINRRKTTKKKKPTCTSCQRKRYHVKLIKCTAPGRGFARVSNLSQSKALRKTSLKMERVTSCPPWITSVPWLKDLRCTLEQLLCQWEQDWPIRFNELSRFKQFRNRLVLTLCKAPLSLKRPERMSWITAAR